MDGDDLLPNNTADPLQQLARQDLDPLSVDELQQRVVALEVEVARIKAKIATSINQRISADALFRR